MEVLLQKIEEDQIKKSGVNLFVLRLDQIHPCISGNKWFKLKYNIQEIKRQFLETPWEQSTVLTFGGAFSNHIVAVAAAGKEFGFNTIGIIRGDEHSSPQSFNMRSISSTLNFAESCGMKLHFVSREQYRQKSSVEFIDLLIQQFGDFYLLPEGGTNALAVKGCAEITSHIEIPFDYIGCPVGTGGTLAGIISSLNEKQKAIGFSALKDGYFLNEEVEKLLTSFPSSKGDIHTEYHFGGYAKHTPELLKFISDFEKQNQIPLDHVYTGKMIFGIYDLIKKNYFPENSTIIAVHTGGLQGKLKVPVMNGEID